MKSLRLRSLLLLPVSLLPALAHAHPGHDGDHEFGWDYEHLASHPLATILCFAVVGAAAWGVWSLLRRNRAKSAPVPAKRR